MENEDNVSMVIGLQAAPLWPGTQQWGWSGGRAEGWHSGGS